MAETIFVIAKILGALFLLCKFISKFSQTSEPDEAIKLLGKTLSMRTGNFTYQEKIERN